MKSHSTTISTFNPASSCSSSSSTLVSSNSSTTLVSSKTSSSSDSASFSFSYESMAMHTSECDWPLQSIAPLRQETAEMEILAGITQLAVMLDRKDGLDEAHQEERDRLASGIEDAKVLLGLHLCRIENDVTRQVLLDTFLLHLGPTDAPWMLGPLLARIASGI